MKVVFPLLLICSLTLRAYAQPILIESFPGNGSLSWNGNATNFTSYHIEWAPSVNGPWFASWNALTNLPASNTTMSVTVPMFYRVVGLTRPPLGDDCENAQTNTSGTYSGTTVGFANNFNPAASPAPGRDRAYRITVPPLRLLTATLSPTNAPLLDVVLLAYSGEVNCSNIESNLLASADVFTVGMSETLNWTNDTASPVELLVVADSFTAEPAGDFLLTLELTSTLPGDICTTAETVTNGTINNLTTANYIHDQATGTNCADAAGPDRYFLYTMPGAVALDVTVVPTTPWDACINIVSATAGCPAPVNCLTGVDATGVSGLETVAYTNTLGGSLDVFIVVSGFSAGDAGGFNLTTELQ